MSRICAIDEYAWIVRESRANCTYQQDYGGEVAVRVVTTSNNIADKSRPVKKRAEDVDLAEVVIHKSHQKVIWGEGVLAVLRGWVRRVFPLEKV